MRFNGQNILDVSPLIVKGKEIPPGSVTYGVESVSGINGRFVTGAVIKGGERYTVKVGIASINQTDAFDVRRRLAQWATSAGRQAAELEPTSAEGYAYDAVFERITQPKRMRHFWEVEVQFYLPSGLMHETAESVAKGNGTAIMQISGTQACRPVIRQTISRDAARWTLSIKDKPGGAATAFFEYDKPVTAGQKIAVDTQKAAFAVDGVHKESELDPQKIHFRAGFEPGQKTIISTDGGNLEVRWRNVWD